MAPKNNNKNRQSSPQGRNGGIQSNFAQELVRLFQAALQAHQTGQLEAAGAGYRQVLAIDGQHADAWHLLGIVHHAQGDLREAETHIRRALAIHENPDFLCSLGNALTEAKRSSDAESAYHRAIALEPRNASAHNNLGKLLADMRRFPEAEAAYRRAIAVRPDDALTYSNLGNLLADTERLTEAESAYKHALELFPNDDTTYYNLGNALHNQGRLDEAEAAYRHALAITPGFWQAIYNLGNTWLDLDRLGEAEAAFRRVLQLRPNDALAHNNLGKALRQMGRLGEAEMNYRRAVQLDAGFAEACGNLGNVLADLGELDESRRSYREAIRLKPEGFVGGQGLVLFSLNYGEYALDECLAEARRYGRMVAEKVSSRFTGWQCTAKPERLRIGFVSGDLRQHPVGHFLEGVLAHIDPQRLELFAYPTHNQTDELTARIKPHFAAWTPLLGLNDETAARRIQADGVHILIDLSGHTAHNRLPLFAWKPAPVQVSWLGYFATTGVAEMDYFIADPHTLPAGEERQFTETVWRLPDTRLCFTAPDADVAIAELPALANGYITFGCFNSLTKINDRVIVLWARLLDAVPGSRLMLKAKQLKEALVQDKMRERFAAHGVSADRLLLEGPEARAEYLAAYNRIDIALDPFPFTGGTTTAECLWMGVPVLTLAGDRLVSRQGVGLLANAGLPDWIATDADDYVSKAVLHASNPQALAALRRSLRQQVLASPVFDGERFARHLENALQDMWEEREPAQTLQANTSQKLNTAFKIYQIFYDDKSRKMLDPGFIPLDNSKNLRPDWYEFWVIRDYLLNNELDDNCWYGFLSPSFVSKTNLSAQTLHESLKLMGEHADVAIFSHSWEQTSYFLNPFEQGEFWHPGLMRAAEQFFAAANVKLDVRNYAAHSQNSVYSNYLVARPVFWRLWLKLANLLFEQAEAPSGEMADLLRQSVDHGSGAIDTQMKVFVQERIAPVLLATENFRVMVADMSSHPIFEALFTDDLRTRRLLGACDTLKLEYSQSGNDDFLDMYKKVRASIPTRQSIPSC